MISLRGDGHKFYLRLRRKSDSQQPLDSMKEIREMTEIKHFYKSLTMNQLENIRYRMMKEQGGNGLFPILVSSLPWLAFIFSKELRTLLTRSTHLLFLFIFLYIFFIVASTVLHYREKAWASVHLEIIQHVMKEKTE